MIRQIGTGEVLVIVFVLLVVFGAGKLPGLARAIGSSAREFRQGLEEGTGDTPPNGDEPDA